MHARDIANLAFSYGVDAERVVFAPIHLEEHSLISTAVVAMPGTQLPGVRRTPATHL